MRRKGQDVCVVAGPGSGKTHVLVERFAWHVEQGVPAERILAITFTEKAALEIRQRLARRFAHRDDLHREIDRAPVSTIDGFCLKLLKENAIAAGVDPEFKIFDEMDAYAEQIAALERVLNRFANTRRDEFRKLLDAWKATSLVPNFLDVYEAMRTGQGLDSLDQRLEPNFADSLRELRTTVQRMVDTHGPATSDKQAEKLRGLRQWLSRDPKGAALWPWLAAFDANKTTFRKGPIYQTLDRVKEELIPAVDASLATAHFRPEWRVLRDIIAGFDTEYRARKRELAALDFGDLEEQALALLRRDRRLRKDLQDEFDFILMDELQDTNPLQWAILDEIRQPDRFFAVGDINQSIYGFRHAEPDLFDLFQKGFAERRQAVEELRRNYRSRSEILDAVGAVTATLPGIQPHALLAEREFPPKAEPSVEVIFAESAQAEALWISRRICDLKGRLRLDRRGKPGPVEFSDFAVLARNSAVFEELENALQRFAVPYIVQRGRNFFDELEVVDLTNWLRVLARDDDEIAQYGLLRSPFFRCSDEDLFTYRLSNTPVPPDLTAKIAALRTKAASGETADLLLARLMDECGYETTLEPRARANVRKFMAFLRRLQSEFPGNIESWLRAIRDLRRLGREPNAPLVDATEAVRVTTIHMSKGLEFPIVFIMGMQKGTDSFAAPLSWSAEAGLGVNWRAPGTEDSTPDAAHLANRQRSRQREERESNRLLYVAMTRAEEHLVLSFEKGRKGSWPDFIESGLGIHWNIPPNHAVVQNNIRLHRVVGDPDIPEPTAPASGVQPANVVWLSPLSEERQPESALPVTAIIDYAQCPYRFFLGSVAGWPKPAPGAAAQTGTTVHALLAGQPAQDATPVAKTLADAFRNSVLGQRAARAQTVEKEFGFLTAIGETIVAGVIDLWFIESDRLVVVDYKTDRRPSEEKLRAYERQLQFYAITLEKLTGRPVDEAYLFLLRSATAHRVPVDSVSKSSAAELVRVAASAKEFPRREGTQCLYCPFYKGVCPAQPELASPTSPEQPEEEEDSWPSTSTRSAFPEPS